MAEEKESFFDKAKEAVGGLKDKVTGGGEEGNDGLLGKAKEFAGTAKERVSGVFEKNEDKIDSGFDKAADFVDGKTKGKFSERIGKAKETVHGGVHKLAGSDDGGQTAEGGEAGGAGEAGRSGAAGSTGEAGAGGESAEGRDEPTQ